MLTQITRRQTHTHAHRRDHLNDVIEWVVTAVFSFCDRVGIHSIRYKYKIRK